MTTTTASATATVDTVSNDNQSSMWM